MNCERQEEGMGSNPSSAARIAKRIAVVIAASYLGAILAAGLYEAFWIYGFHFQGLAGDMTGLAVVFLVAVPIASALASVLVSRYADHVRPSTLGGLVSLVASFLGACVGEVLWREIRLGGVGLRQVLFFLWPAWGEIYAFIGYQAGLMVVRRWRSPRKAAKAGG